MNHRFIPIAALGRGLPLLSFVLLACAEPGPSVQSMPPAAEGQVWALSQDQVELPEASQGFIRVEKASKTPNAAILRAPARVVFRDGATARIGAPLDGRVVTVHVRTGDQVAAGAPLVTLDCPAAASSRAELVTARAAAREARAALARQQRMIAQGVGTERERLRAEREAAEAEAEVVRAEAAVRFVGEQRGTTVVLAAPIDGTVVSREVTVGAAVEPGGAPLVELGDPSDLWLVADVFERDLHLVREGAQAEIELRALSAPVKGRVTSVGTVVEGAARTAPVRIGLQERPTELRPGMFGRVRINAIDGALTVPTKAVLIKEGRETIVYVQTAPGLFSRREVSVAHPIDGRVVVTAGLSGGEPVVVGGALLLDGAAEQLL